MKGENHEDNSSNKERILDRNRTISAWIGGIFRHQHPVCVR
jgi:hypothetical protein